MTIFAQLLEKLYRVAAKYRCALIVVGAAALAPLSLGLSGPALAANECGPLVGGSVTCPAGNYPDGIGYNTGDPAAPNQHHAIAGCHSQLPGGVTRL